MLDATLIRDIKDSLIFIPILSPSYLNSTYCQAELEVFFNQHNIDQETATRIFPVVKENIISTPPQISGNLRKFQFIVNDEFGNLTVQLDPSLGGDLVNKFFQKVNDLAREIAEFITNLQLDPTVEPSPVKNVPKIYLAEPSPDLIDKYLEIKRDLEERKKQGKIEFEFLPRNLPEDLAQIEDKPEQVEQYKQIVREDVEKSRLTVHLIGKRTNGFPPNHNQSYLQLAMDVAAERDGQPGFNRLVWIPKNVYTEEEMAQEGNRHKDFIKSVRQTGVNGDGLMQGSFEEFKTRIIETLMPAPAPIVVSNSEDETSIYVLCDKSDLDSVGELEELLQNHGFPIFSSRDYLKPTTDDNSQKTALENHNDYLTRCDAIVIYWQNAPLTWVRTSADDVRKIKAVRKERDFRFQLVLVGGDPQAPDKIGFRAPPPKNLYKINYSDATRFISRIAEGKNQ